MLASRTSLIIGIGALVYLVAMLVGGQDNTFDYSLLLVILSPALSLLCVAGLVFGIVASRKSARAKVTNYEATAGIILNGIGIIGPSVVPLIALF